MSYREERDALRARVEVLEQDLEQARGNVRRLLGEPAPIEPAPTRAGEIVLLREVAVGPSDAGLRAIEELARARLGSRGEASVTDGAMRYSSAGVELRVVPGASGGAQVTLAFRFAWRALAAILATATAVVAAVATGGLAHALGAPRWSALVILLVWSCISGAFWSWRLRRAFEQTAAFYRGLLEAVADLALAHPRTRRRVRGTDDDADHDAAEADDAIASTRAGRGSSRA